MFFFITLSRNSDFLLFRIRLILAGSQFSVLLRDLYLVTAFIRQRDMLSAWT